MVTFHMRLWLADMIGCHPDGLSLHRTKRVPGGQHAVYRRDRGAGAEAWIWDGPTHDGRGRAILAEWSTATATTRVPDADEVAL